MGDVLTVNPCSDQGKFILEENTDSESEDKEVLPEDDMEDEGQRRPNPKRRNQHL